MYALSDEHGSVCMSQVMESAAQELLDEFGRHDSGNSSRLHRLHGYRIRYIPRWDSWLTWDGHHWDLDHGRVVVAELAKDVGRELVSEATEMSDRGAVPKAFAWASQSLGAGRISSMIDLARGIGDIPVDHEALDVDPWLLGVRNGVVDLRTGKFRQADPADLMTMQAPIEWDGSATAPRWEKALAEWFPNPETRAYVQRLVGQAMVGLQQDHLFVIHYGTGRNGKSTFVRALESVLGPYAVTPDVNLLTENRWGPHATATSTLFRARLAVASETERRVKLAEASIKNLTGGDRISARRLYENPWSFTPSHSLWLMTNYKPQIVGRDPGIWRRIRMVPWTATFDPRGDVDLGEQLSAEAPGILRWCVAGVAEWLKHGLSEPVEVILATSEYHEAEDLLGRFAADVGLEFGAGFSISKTELATTCATWADTEGIEVLNTALRDWIVDEHGCRERRDDFQTDDGKRHQRRVWVGVGFGSDTAPAPDFT